MFHPLRNNPELTDSEGKTRDSKNQTPSPNGTQTPDVPLGLPCPPLILHSKDYGRWLSDEPDPSDLLVPFPAEPMRMWPISTRVNKPKNDDPSIVELIKLSAA
jgi:hypothetical protein